MVLKDAYPDDFPMERHYSTEVLLCLYRDDGINKKEISDRIGASQSTIKNLVIDMSECGYIGAKMGVTSKPGTSRVYYLTQKGEDVIRHIRLEVGLCQ